MNGSTASRSNGLGDTSALSRFRHAAGSTAARTKSSNVARSASTLSRCGRAGLPVARSIVLTRPLNTTASTTSPDVATKISCRVRNATLAMSFA